MAALRKRVWQLSGIAASRVSKSKMWSSFEKAIFHPSPVSGTRRYSKRMSISNKDYLSAIRQEQLDFESKLSQIERLKEKEDSPLRIFGRENLKIISSKLSQYEEVRRKAKGGNDESLSSVPTQTARKPFGTMSFSECVRQEVSPLTSGSLSHSNEPLNNGASLTGTGSPPTSPPDKFDDVVKNRRLKEEGRSLNKVEAGIIEILSKMMRESNRCNFILEVHKSQEVSPLTSGRLSHSSEPLNGGTSLTGTDSPPISSSDEFDDVVKIRRLKEEGGSSNKAEAGIIEILSKMMQESNRCNFILEMHKSQEKECGINVRSHSGSSLTTPSNEELRTHLSSLTSQVNEMKEMITYMLQNYKGQLPSKFGPFQPSVSDQGNMRNENEEK